MTSQTKKLVTAVESGKKIRFRRWNNMSVSARIAVIVLLVLALISALAPLLAPYSASFVDTDAMAAAVKATRSKESAPSMIHLFGTDSAGRDVLSRLLLGGKYSMIIGLSATFIALVIGAIIGSVAAVVRKWISEVIMRIMDIIMAVPGIAMAAVMVLVFSGIFPPGNQVGLVTVIIIAIAFVYIPQLARIVRANVMSAYGEDYVRAVIVSGARAPWILTKHVVRNTAAPVLVFATVLVADAIILEASLTFIGTGLKSSLVPTWGNVLSDASTNGSINHGAWWTALFPGLLIMITVLCLNILSEGITDAMVAAPASAPVKVEQNTADREADALLLDPRRAYQEQAESLRARLDALREVEQKRQDRMQDNFTGEPLLEVKDLCIKFPRHGDVNVVDHCLLYTSDAADE